MDNVAADLGFLVTGAVVGGLLGHSQVPAQPSFIMPSTPPKKATEVLEDIKAQEIIDQDYTLETTWWMYGEQIEKPTSDQLANASLLRRERYVRKESK